MSLLFSIVFSLVVSLCTGKIDFSSVESRLSKFSKIVTYWRLNHFVINPHETSTFFFGTILSVSCWFLPKICCKFWSSCTFCRISVSNWYFSWLYTDLLPAFRNCNSSSNMLSIDFTSIVSVNILKQYCGCNPR